MQNIKFIIPLLSIGLINLSASLACASGNIESPEQKVEFKNHNKCMIELKKVYTGIQQTKNQKMPEIPDVTSKIEIESKTNGIKIIDNNNAEYDSKVWYHHSTKNPALGKIETSHTYSAFNYKCAGKFMIINSSQGYTLSTFEDIPKADQASKP